MSYIFKPGYVVTCLLLKSASGAALKTHEAHVTHSLCPVPSACVAGTLEVTPTHMQQHCMPCPPGSHMDPMCCLLRPLPEHTKASCGPLKAVQGHIVLPLSRALSSNRTVTSTSKPVQHALTPGYAPLRKLHQFRRRHPLEQCENNQSLTDRHPSRAQPSADDGHVRCSLRATLTGEHPRSSRGAAWAD